MAIEIIVEDGTGLPDANSYVTVADARAYATARGKGFPVDDDAVAALLIRGADYIASVGSQFKGRRATVIQSLDWPRSYVEFDCEAYPNNQIPRELATAQIELAIAGASGVDLLPTFSVSDFKNYVTKKKVGPLEKEFAKPGVAELTMAPVFTYVESLLERLFRVQGFSLTTVRV